LVRNPHFAVWWGPAQPAGLPDTIDFSINLTGGKGAPLDQAAGFRATAAGRVDRSYARPLASALETVRTRYPAQLHVVPAPATQWVTLNTRRGPFNNEHARRALAFALD